MNGQRLNSYSPTAALSTKPWRRLKATGRTLIGLKAVLLPPANLDRSFPTTQILPRRVTAIEVRTISCKKSHEHLAFSFSLP